jgi:hypothetical protein
MDVPLRRQRSRKSSGCGSRRPLSSIGVNPPEIGVRCPGGRYGGFAWVHARIQIRRLKYRYLVWYEHGRKREFYLGQVKPVPLSGHLLQLAGAGGRGSGPWARAGVRIRQGGN